MVLAASAAHANETSPAKPATAAPASLQHDWTADGYRELIARNRRDEQRVRDFLAAKGVQVAGDQPAPKSRRKAAAVQTSGPGIAEFQKRYLRERRLELEEEAKEPTPVAADPCNPQRFFIRRDSLDNYLYGITPASKAVGASISYANDRLAGQQALTVNGMVSYVLLRELCPPTPGPGVPFLSAHAVAPYVNAQGNFTVPQSRKEASSLQAGIEGQFEVSQFIIARHVFTASPYVQTDFRQEARATGANFYWDLYDAGLHLGGYFDTNPYLGWFLQLRGEGRFVNVQEPGRTGLTKGNSAWIGGTARLHMFLFPFAMDVHPLIRNRFSLVASAEYFHDTYSGIDIRKYTAALRYTLSPEGNSALAFEYSRGTDKDTLIESDQYLVKLTFAY
jgi:hypothetical protein